jgi:dCTP deaminase
MILSDSEILKEIELGNIIITPFERSQLGSNSYDVRLGNKLAVYKDFMLDSKKHNEVDIFEIPEEGYILHPNRFYLGVTLEYTETRKHVSFIEGKSSGGRLGISIHETAGKGDVNFFGHWTLEISVKHHVRVYAGMPIGQLIYFEVKGDVINPYDKKQNAKYSQQGALPVESMMWKNKF